MKRILFIKQALSRSLIGGFTMVELLFVIGIMTLLAAVAYPSYRSMLDRRDIEEAILDLREIESGLERFRTINFRYPNTLAEAGLAGGTDPWGNAYQYLDIATAANPGLLRKDQNLVPINTDYDLYSLGKDGVSMPPLTANPSRDDVVRANNGGFFGLAVDY